MRDFHKLQERQGVSLTGGQLYGLLAGALALAAVAFGLGYSIGLQKSGALSTGEEPLIPQDVQNESVALMLARAVEEEVDAGSLEKLELKYSNILPSKSGEGVAAPLPDGSMPDHGQGSPRPEGAAGAEEGVAGGAAPAAVTEPVTPQREKASPGEDPPGGSSRGGTAGGKDGRDSAAEREPQGAGKPGKEEGAAAVDGATSRAEAGATATRSATPKVESKEKTPAVDQDPTGGTGSGFTVQVSSHPESGLADRQVRQLIAQGFAAYRVEAEVNGQRWYRVRVGNFMSQDAAEKELQRLRAARSELKPMIAHR